MTSLQLWLLLGVAVMCVCACEGRHLHIRPSHRDEIVDIWDDRADRPTRHSSEETRAALHKSEDTADEIAPIDIIKNTKPVWFVPINSPYFFGVSKPCDDGYKRDKFGICREVW